MKTKIFAKLRWMILTTLLAISAGIPISTHAQVPQISLPLVPSSTSPGSVPATGTGLTITVNGTGFTPSSVLAWNGNARPTRFISSTRLAGTITAEDVESPGTAWVTVLSQISGVSNSNAAYFEIANPINSVSFTTSNYPAGDGPRSVAVGDFNGDGKLDLAVANYAASNSVSVLLGNGDGTFQLPVNYAAGPSPYEVSVGDFNGDGKLDLAVADTGGSVSVLLGIGDGTFQASATYTTGHFSTSIAVGDFNGDGKLDLVVANLYGCGPPGCGVVSVLLGNGDGTFQAPVDYLAGGLPIKVAVGDFNGDGKLDLAVANQPPFGVNVLMGNGDGTFQAPVTYMPGSNTQSIAAGDFNGDGKLDLAVGDADAGGVSVLSGNGDGTFQAPVIYATGGGPYSVAVGDFNGDGKPDLAVANFSDSTVSMLLGNGDGTFQPAVNYATGTGSISVAVGDFNGDGRMDLTVADFGSNNISILLQPSPTAGIATLGSNTFTGNQAVNGTVSATSFVGDGSGLTGITASNANTANFATTAGTANTANFATSAGTADTATNSLSLGGILAANFARLDIGNSFTGTQSVSGDLSLTGNLSGGTGTFSGNVGMGVSSPMQTLSVYSAANDSRGGIRISGVTPAVFFNNGPETLNFSTQAGGLGLATIQNGQNFGYGALPYDLNLFTEGGNINLNTTPNFAPANPNIRMTVTAGGNVGIGTTTPAATLEVNGTAQFDNTVTFAAGQTFPGAGSITAVTAGTGLSGGGTSGAVTLNNTGVLSLTAGSGITSTGGQTPALSLNTSFTDGRYAQLGAANTFTANQVVPNLTASGTVTSSAGNFSGNNDSQIIAVNQAGNGSALTANGLGNQAALVIEESGYGVLGSGTSAGVVGASLGGFGVIGTSGGRGGVFASGNIGVTGTGNSAGVYGISNTGTAGAFNVTSNGKILSGQNSGTEVFSVASNGNLSTSGSLTTTGSVAIGNGTPITEHLSMTVTPSFALLNSLACTSANFTLTGAADGDTLALGVPNSMLNVDVPLVFTAWVSTANTVTLRVCNFSGAKQKVAATGNIRIDVWKH